MLFIGAYDRGLYGLDAATGRVIWREVFSNGVVAASPALAMAKGRALLIAACTDRVLYAFEAATGKRAWSVETRPWTQSSAPAVMSSPTPAVLFGRAVVFVGVWNAERSGLANAQDGELWALDAADGSTVWKLRLGTSAATSPAVAPLRGGVTVLVAAEDGTVRALDARNGREMWVRTLHQELRSSPAVFSADGVPMLAIGTRFHSVYGLGAASGAKLWRYQTGNWVDAAPAVALTGDDEGDDAAPLVLAGSYDYSLYALSAAGKGKPAWRLPGANEFRGPAAVARVAGKPAVFAVSFDDTLHLLSADDGRPLWRHSAGPLLFGHEFQGDALWPGPVVADLGGPLGPLVFFPAHDGKLYAFRAKGS
jgi:outer membrane protein assembly factor BamB